MSELATYSFIPWVRQGIANEINSNSGLRATVQVNLKPTGTDLDGNKVTATVIPKDIEIYGPADVTGIDTKNIIRVEPKNWIANFEPNYLPFIEFYDEDLPWRYSPLTPNGHRLMPWITLIVLKESEFDDGKNAKDRPLPYIRPNSSAQLPPNDQLWAWSHVHINKSILNDGQLYHDDEKDISADLESELGKNADVGFSRIICPRKLEANSAYHLFLVPTFNTGLVAGLGGDISALNDFDAPAWTEGNIPLEIPYYYRSFFKTGSKGDFEYLVRLLKPQPINSEVGLRDIDVQQPGANIAGIIDDPATPEDLKLHGVLKLGGALKIPDAFYSPEEYKEVKKYREWYKQTQPYPHPFQSELAAFINLSDSYQEKAALEANNDSNIGDAVADDDEFGIVGNPDPLITAPLYGQWHALQKRLLKDRDGNDYADTINQNWVHELNLDPTWRTSAGFGTKVVQENQETYMQAAWEQVGDIVAANRKIFFAQLAKEVSYSWYTGSMQTIKDKQPDRFLSLTAPVHQRLMKNVTLEQGDATLEKKATVFHELKFSAVPQALLSANMRKVLRPRGILAKRLPFSSEITPFNIVSRVNDGQVSAAPPREIPVAATDIDQLTDQVVPSNPPSFLGNLVNKNPWLRWLFLAIAAILIILLFFINKGAAAYGIIGGIAILLIVLFFLMRRWGFAVDAVDNINPRGQTPEAVDDWPKIQNFKIVEPGEEFRPIVGISDSEEGKRFKAAIKDNYALLQGAIYSYVPPKATSFSVLNTGLSVFEALTPQLTIPKWIWGSIVIPDYIKVQLFELFVEAMAYPEIDLPMYKPLANYSPDLFLPNINKIAQNSISILATNQKFIESYMVGLNHEFARELKWREYPTDQRGSYFRQFWDVSSYHTDEDLTPEQRKEKLKDIPEIHLWSRYSELGGHDHRQEPGEEPREEVVLVIRGELLKKYPNAVIYAQRAAWRDENEDEVIDEANNTDKIDPKKERTFKTIPESEQENPSNNYIRTPLYEAKVDPDIYFFGFDLTVCEANGGTGSESVALPEACQEEDIKWHDPGWFFVIKERPGEPRFGLDIGSGIDENDPAKVDIWNDLGWEDITPAVPDGNHIQINNQTQTIDLESNPLTGDEAEKEVQREDDILAVQEWSKDMSSAQLAYVLYQVPVLVGVHASEMLPKKNFTPNNQG